MLSFPQPSSPPAPFLRCSIGTEGLNFSPLDSKPRLLPILVLAHLKGAQCPVGKLWMRSWRVVRGVRMMATAGSRSLGEMELAGAAHKQRWAQQHRGHLLPSPVMPLLLLPTSCQMVPPGRHQQRQFPASELHSNRNVQNKSRPKCYFIFLQGVGSCRL